MALVAVLLVQGFTGCGQCCIEVLLGRDKRQLSVVSRNGIDGVIVKIGDYCAHRGFRTAGIAVAEGTRRTGTFFIAVDVQRIRMYELGDTCNGRNVGVFTDTGGPVTIITFGDNRIQITRLGAGCEY